MVFGKIEYLNLLEFHVFMKRFTKNTQQSMSMHYKRGVPSYINKEFESRRVDAAFISSVTARTYKNVKLGIIAKDRVKSVIVLPDEHTQKDEESATSNILASLLNVEGKILIGDKALAYALESDNYIDLAKEWKNKHSLPFVFALFCYHENKQIYKSIEKNFLKQKTKIPQYILKQASARTGIDTQDILEYLKLISYEYNIKAQHGLKKFYVLMKSSKFL